ncbi:hypothetical protein AVEN_71233-1 [Araneus ventricosus]|uniref:Uncharacterized protein n=1 Tax=Araneus ventricosus TaxID=182803 RepID=A0A4Y2SU16_ARAVE|nr:hypothetical protein AVEN_71233-1 [Araneus ventricosus]
MQVQAESVSEHTVQRHRRYGISEQTSHSCASAGPSVIVNYACSGPGTRDWTMDEWQRVACSDELDFSFITPMVMLGHAVCQANGCCPSCTAGHTQAGGSGIMLGDVLMGGSWDP